ncbi:MAG: tetratricopeptide repeat protein [Shimia sp.]
MSETDSFIDEVNDEVRCDRLYGAMRRYGWIAVLAIVALVGGTAWSEFQKARTERAAQATGDALSAALEVQDPAESAAALSALAPDNVVAAFLAGTQFLEADDPQAAAQAFAAVADDPDADPLYRDLAQLKRLNALPDTAPAERRLVLDGLARPGAPYRLVAEELLALDAARGGEAEAAIERLQRVLEDSEATPGQQARVTQLIVALGGTPVLANSRLDGSAVESSE